MATSKTKKEEIQAGISQDRHQVFNDALSVYKKYLLEKPSTYEEKAALAKFDEQSSTGELITMRLDALIQVQNESDNDFSWEIEQLERARDLSVEVDQSEFMEEEALEEIHSVLELSSLAESDYFQTSDKEQQAFIYSEELDYFNRFMGNEFVEQVSDAVGVEWDEVPLPDEFIDINVNNAVPYAPPIPVIALTEAEQLIAKIELEEAEELLLEEQKKKKEESATEEAFVKRSLAIVADEPDESDEPDEPKEEASLSEERLNALLQNHFIETERLISSSIKVITSESKSNLSMAKLIYQAFSKQMEQAAIELKTQINEIKVSTGPIEDVRAKRTLKSFFSNAYKSFKERFSKNTENEATQSVPLSQSNRQVEQGNTGATQSVNTRPVPPVPSIPKVEQAVQKVVPLNVLRAPSKAKAFVEEQEKHLAQQNKREVLQTVEDTVQTNPITESDLEVSLEQYYLQVENFMEKELAKIQQERMASLEEIRTANQVNQTTESVDVLTQKVEDLESKLSVATQQDHHKSFREKTKEALGELGGNLKKATNAVVAAPGKAVENVQAFTSQFVDNRLESLNNGLKKVTNHLDYRLASELNKTIDLDALELSVPQVEQYDKLLLNQLYTKHNEGLGNVTIDIQKEGVELNYSDKIKYVYDGEDCKKFAVDYDGKWAEQGSLYKAVDSELILQETQDLMEKAVTYGIDTDEAFTEKEFRTIFQPEATEKEILNAIHTHRNEMMVDWVYNDTKSDAEIDNYDQQTQLNLVKSVVNGHPIYIMGEEMELLVSASTKGPNDYQLTTFDKVGPISDFQAGSLAEVANILKEKNAIPATKDSMELVNKLATKDATNQMEKQRQHNQVMQRTFKKEVGREMSR